jgi:basic membrane protein A
VGVDNDWAIVNADYADIVLTSVLKNMDITTVDAIKAAKEGTFKGGVTVGTLPNGGVVYPFLNLIRCFCRAEAEVETVKQTSSTARR